MKKRSNVVKFSLVVCDFSICIDNTLKLLDVMSKKPTLFYFFKRKCEMELDSDTESVGIKKQKMNQIHVQTHAGTN